MFFSEKFGLFHVNFNDPERKRTGKKSAEVYSKIIKSNKIPVELLNVEISQWSCDAVGSSEFNLHHLITPWTRVLIEKLIGLQLVK